MSLRRESGRGGGQREPLRRTRVDVDFAADDTPIGVEFIDARFGIDLRDVPAEREIGRIAEELRLRVFA